MMPAPTRRRATKLLPVLAVPALALLLAAAGALVSTAPAHAAACATADVTVVVKFPDRTRTGCASGDPSSGYEALKLAGFAITYAQGSGAGAICRIDGYPRDNSCGSMPSADAYWAYFHAKPGGSWSYSTEGGGTYDPAPGSVEGWKFGGSESWGGKAPGVGTPPKPTSAPSPSARPTTRASARPTKAPAAGDRTATPGAGPTATPTATASDQAAPPVADPTAPPTGGTTTGPTDGPVDASSSTESSTSTSDPADADGGSLSWIWGLVLLAVIGGAGGLVLRRRGRA